jgi:Arc/MetJ family transcription regulator
MLSMTMSTRINARIDDELARQLEELRQRTGQTLVEAALRARVREQLGRPSASEIFAATGFIGSGAGPRDLARSSKKCR